MQRILALATLSTCLTTSLALAQSTVVVPAGYDIVEGNSNNSFPWGYSTTTYTSMRHQQVYDTSNFTGQSINQPILIQGMRLRENGGGTHPGGTTHSNVVVQMASCTVDHTAVSVATAWPGHLGPDLMTVFSGNVTSTASAGTTPNNWIVDVVFTNPFLYDPTAGNDLVVDVDRPLMAGTSFFLDNVGTGGASPPNGSRVYGYPTPAGTTINYALVCEFTYVPATGLYAGFTSDVTSGPSPLAVNFQDTSYSSHALGVLAWAWDFENDGTVDSTLQNPSHTYPTCGSYDVSLTVTDAQFPMSTVVRTGYINTDTVEADFTHSIIGPLVVAFTDTSTGPATAWDWDLDGDGTTDSTAQNPAWAYTNANPVAITLTVTRLCSAPDTITKTIVPVTCLETLYAGGNGGGAGWTMFMDCDVTNPQGIEITSIDANLNASTLVETIDIYIGSDTYTGNELNAAHWQLVATGSGTSNGPGVPSPMTLNNPIYLPPGDYAIAMHYSGGMPYTNGNGTNQTYSNGDLTLNLGISRSTTFGAPFGATGGIFNPRVWNGGICYDIYQIGGGAGYGFGGSGCPGSNGSSALVASADPVLGTTMSVDITNMADIGGGVSAGVLMSGFSNTTSPLGALPFDLTAFGAPGCSLRVSPDITTFVAGINGTATWTITIPNDPALGGVLYYQQAVVIDPAFNLAGAVGSHAGGLLIGN